MNLGVFVCEVCAGVHRKLGTHISQVKSVALDEWKPEWLDRVRQVGNERARAYYEHNVPEEERHIAMSANIRGADRLDPVGAALLERWIRRKYEERRFAPKGVDPPASRPINLKRPSGDRSWSATVEGSYDAARLEPPPARATSRKKGPLWPTCVSDWPDERNSAAQALPKPTAFGAFACEPPSTSQANNRSMSLDAWPTAPTGWSNPTPGSGCQWPSAPANWRVQPADWPPSSAPPMNSWPSSTPAQPAWPAWPDDKAAQAAAPAAPSWLAARMQGAPKERRATTGGGISSRVSCLPCRRASAGRYTGRSRGPGGQRSVKDQDGGEPLL